MITEVEISDFEEFIAGGETDDTLICGVFERKSIYVDYETRRCEGLPFSMTPAVARTLGEWLIARANEMEKKNA